MKKLIQKTVLVFLFIGAIVALFFISESQAFFWQNEPEMTKQEIYEQDSKTRELARQVFVQTTLASLKSQKEYAKEKGATAIINEDTVELTRITEVITKLNKEITDVQQHTKIVFMRARE